VSSDGQDQHGQHGQQGQQGRQGRQGGRGRQILAKQWPFILVCAGVAAGLAVTFFLDRFRRGTVLIAASVILGAWMRALLPSKRVGLLRVRGKAFDVATMAVLGVALAAVALSVPSAT
jgi:hypothetical protein